MTSRDELHSRLKFAIKKTEMAVSKNYNDELANSVIRKLKNIIQNLNFSSFQKSIAIFISPLYEKVLYLDIEVNEKIIIDESFDIRDLIYAKKERQGCMAVVLSEKKTKVFICRDGKLVKIKSNTPDHVAIFESEPEGSFYDYPHPKEFLLNRFLKETDRDLTFLLNLYALPVFVLGTPKVLGHFRAITKNGKNIFGNIEGCYEESSEVELNAILQLHIGDWKKLKTKYLLRQLEITGKNSRVDTGIVDVWNCVLQHKARLLIVEKNFIAPWTKKNADEKKVIKPAGSYDNFSCIKDTVDDLVEKVLVDGGDVEFVDDGVLRDQGGIAVIEQ
jgi:hypothetical protein